MVIPRHSGTQVPYQLAASIDQQEICCGAYSPTQRKKMTTWESQLPFATNREEGGLDPGAAADVLNKRIAEKFRANGLKDAGSTIGIDL